MKIFITGSTGFIGKHLVKNLKARGHELFLLDKDLADIKEWINEVKNFNPDAVIHLAWQGIPDYGPETSAKNLKYGLDLIENLSKIGCKWVLSAGSCWEYGGKAGKISEDAEIKPINDFTKAKNDLHIKGREIAQKNNIDFIWTRFFYVYGPGQKETSLIPYLIKCVREGKTPEIKNPNAKNDFIYVEDLAEALAELVENKVKTNVYNIGSGKLTAVQDVIKIIYENFKLEPKKKDTAPGSTDIYSDFFADISKIKKDAGWQPKTTIEQGIKNTIDYLNKQ